MSEDSKTPITPPKKRKPGRPKGTTRKPPKPKYGKRGRPPKPVPPPPAKESPLLIDELPNSPLGLAQAILREREEDAASMDIIPPVDDPVEDTEDSISESMPPPTVIEPPTNFRTTPAPPQSNPTTPTRKVLPLGESMSNPVIILRSESQIFRWLSYHFGSGPNSYFVHSDQVFTRRLGSTVQKFKIIIVEDQHKYRYRIWFDISKLSLIR